MRYLTVTRSRGAAWDHSRALDEQDRFAEHASFMNALVAEGFVVLGGPLDEQAVQARLAADPWSAMGLLEVTRVAQWEILLGG